MLWICGLSEFVVFVDVLAVLARRCRVVSLVLAYRPGRLSLFAGPCRNVEIKLWARLGAKAPFSAILALPHLLIS